jgi:hypothetical protein
MPNTHEVSMGSDQWKIDGTVDASKNVVKFLEAVATASQNGFGFVPLLGAGISAPSGIPIVREIHAYLLHCIARSLGIDHPNSWDPKSKEGFLDFEKTRRWMPGLDSWPQMNDLHAPYRDAEDWKGKLYAIIGAMEKREEETKFNCPEKHVFQEAYGAMADWRSALLFLSRLTCKAGTTSNLPPRQFVELIGMLTESENEIEKSNVESPRSKNCRLPFNGSRFILGNPRTEVIDTFFLHVVANKTPTLGHRMLARLSSVLRMDTILTTNFDELMEDAFLEMGRQVTVFDVHVNAGLPPFEVTRTCQSLIKLHGGRYGIRADYSLDSMPSDEDCRRFTSYLACQNILDSQWQRTRASDNKLGMETRRHLLVLGVSASDRRVTSMIIAAANVLRGLHVYWVCYSANDVKNALEFEDRLKEIDPSIEFHILRHQTVGLLLLQLLQHLTCALPAAGAIFPSIPFLSLPPNPLRAIGDAKRTASGFAEEIRQTIRLCSENPDQRPRLVIVTSEPAVTGVVSCAARAFMDEVDSGNQVVWIDLDEIVSADDLFEHLVHAIARKSGVSDWMPVVLDERVLDAEEDDPDGVRLASDDLLRRARIREIRRLTNASNRKWTVFLNAREGAGSNSPACVLFDSEVAWPSQFKNGWLDFTESTSKTWANLDRSANGPAVAEMLERMCSPQADLGGNEKGSSDTCPNLTVVVICHATVNQQSQGDGQFLSFLQSKMHTIESTLVLHESCAAYDTERSASEAVEWILSGAHGQSTGRVSNERGSCSRYVSRTKSVFPQCYGRGHFMGRPHPES